MRRSTVLRYLPAALGLSLSIGWAGAADLTGHTAPTAPGQLTVSPGLSAPLPQGNQADIQFDPASGIVTVRMTVPDPSGNLIPNIRRDDFAVYENGVRQQNVNVDVEHAPISVAVLLEWGGRYQAFNRALGDNIPRAASQLLSEIGPQDKIALWTYADRPAKLADFSASPESLDGLLLTLETPGFSEANFYDALLATLQRMKTVAGRKAVIVLSDGVDTFSKASCQDVLKAAETSETPVYAINLGPALRAEAESVSNTGPHAQIDWNRAAMALQQIADKSGGRLFSPESTFDLSGIYDNIMQTLRVRYVITYKSAANTSGQSATRRVQVELVDPKTGGPLVAAPNGKPRTAALAVSTRYETGSRLQRVPQRSAVR